MPTDAKTKAAAASLMKLPPAASGAKASELRVFVVDLDAKKLPHAHELILEPPPAAEILKAIVGFVTRMGNRTVTLWGAVTLVEGGHCLSLEQSSCSVLQSVEALLATGNTDIFNPTAGYAKNVKMLVARITPSSGTSFTVYRHLGRFMQFGKSGILTLFYQDGRYNTIEPTDLLLFDLEFDVLVGDGRAFFEKKRTFERLFDHMAEIRAKCKQTFAAVTAGLKIDGLQEMEGACTSDPSLMAKMASIARSMESDPDYKKAMSMPKLLNFVDQNNKYNIKTKGAGSSRALVFEERPSERHKIPKLLDDDFLHSPLTDRSYEAGSKSVAG